MNIANKLTLARVCCVPIFVICYYLPLSFSKYVAAIIFLLAFITDIVDGYIARKHNMITNFGKLMDPLADKLLMTAALIVLCADGILHSVFVIIIIGREFMVSGLRMMIKAEGSVIAASILGKLKTVLQCVMVMSLMLRPVADKLLTPYGAVIITWLAVILTVWSGADYFIKNWSSIDLA